MTLASTALTAGVPLNPNWCIWTQRATAKTQRTNTFADAGVDSRHALHSFKLRYWKLKRLTIKGAFPLNFSMRRPRMPGASFPLYHNPANLSREQLYKNQIIIYPVFVHFAMLTFGVGCGILSLSRGRENRKRYRPMGILMALEKKCKNPLTNPLKCDTIRVSRGMRDYRSQLQGRPRGNRIGRASGVA